MKAKLASIMIFSILLALGCKKVEDYMPLEKGNWWEYSYVKEECGVITDDTYIYVEVAEEIESTRYGTMYKLSSESEDDGFSKSYYMRCSDAGLTVYETSDSRVEEIRIQEPFEVNHSWRTSWFKNEDHRTNYRIVDTNASVTVPAGHFTGCIHTVCEYKEDYYTDIPGDETIEIERWYAPGIGVVKIHTVTEYENHDLTGDSVRELVDYGI